MSPQPRALTRRAPQARSTSRAAAVLAATLCLAAVSAAQPAAHRRAGSLTVSELVTPEGVQGAQGAGAHVAFAFRLADRVQRGSQLEVEYAVDRNADGVIADGSDPHLPSEYAPATPALDDPRMTCRVAFARGRTRMVFRPATRDGAAHVFVWDERADLGDAVVPLGPQPALSPEGRVLRNALHPQEVVYSKALSGVRVRVRAVRSGGQRAARSRWVESELFAVDGSIAPEVRIEDLADHAALGVMSVTWAAFDADGEDADGNGLLDVAAGEDRDGDGRLDTAPVSVAFDWTVVAPDAEAPTDDDSAGATLWWPCRERLGYGDGAVLRPSGGVDAGRRWIYVWDYARDLAGYRDDVVVVLRARPLDRAGKRGPNAYSIAQPLTPTPTR